MGDEETAEYLPVFPCVWTNRAQGNGPWQWFPLRERARVISKRAKPCTSNSSGCSAIVGCEVVRPLRKNSKAMTCKPLNRSELFKAPGDWSYPLRDSLQFLFGPFGCLGGCFCQVGLLSEHCIHRASLDIVGSEISCRETCLVPRHAALS